MEAAGSAPAPRKAPGKPWVKGQSGNPKGSRPAGIDDFKAMCRTYTPQAVEYLAKAIMSKRSTARGIKAAEILLAYGWGRPAVQVDMSGNININVAEMLEEAEQRVKLIALEAERVEE